MRLIIVEKINSVLFGYFVGFISAMAHSFVENHVFNNVDNVKSALGEYNKQNYTDMIVDTNNSSSMLIICKHGKSESMRNQAIGPISGINIS